MKRIYLGPMIQSAAISLLLVSFLLPCYALEREQIAKAKQATAFVGHKNGSASAFCIDKSGLFVTNDRLIEEIKGQELTLFLNANSENESAHKAKVLRRDKDSDLALLRIDLGDTPSPIPLELVGIDSLFETQELVAFGFPFGRALSVNKDAVPSISVNIRRITSLQKKGKQLEAIQLDTQVNPAIQEGLCWIRMGRVVGIISSGVRGAGVKFAIPTSRLIPLLAKPDLEVSIPKVPFAEKGKPVEIEAKLTWLQPAPENFTIDLEIATGDEKRKVNLKPAGENRFTASFIPIVPDPDARNPMVQIRLTFPDGQLHGMTRSRDITIDEKSMPLAEIATISFGDAPGIRPFGAATIKGIAKGLKGLKVDLGGQTVTVDGSNASKITVTPPTTSLPSVAYKIDLKDANGGELASVSAPISIGSPPVHKTPGSGGSTLTGGVVIDGAKEIPIPVEIYDIDIAGNGKFLILYLRDAKKLAVFDVTSLKIKGYINLAEDPAVFGGGAEHILIAYPKSNLIVRHSLKTLEKELTVTNPFGTIENIGFGFSSNHYALLLTGNSEHHRDAKIQVFDIQRMVAVDISDTQLDSSITGSSNTLRASADGRLYGNTRGSTSPSGVGIITFKNGKISGRYEHDTRGTIIPNPDGSLIFTGTGGVYTPDYVTVVEGNGNYSSGDRYIPSYHPMYFFSVPVSDQHSRDKTTSKAIKLFVKGSNQPLVSLSEPFEEMKPKNERSMNNSRKSPLTLDKRYHFIPQLNLFLTIPESNDKIVARTIKVHELLEEKEIDYLYVVSTPPPAKALQPFSYQIEAASRAGGVNFSLLSGPDGLDLSPNGLITWSVPEDASEESVIVSVTDSTKRETFYTFQILVSK